MQLYLKVSLLILLLLFIGCSQKTYSPMDISSVHKENKDMNSSYESMMGSINIYIFQEEKPIGRTENKEAREILDGINQQTQLKDDQKKEKVGKHENKKNNIKIQSEKTINQKKSKQNENP